ncbi:MAG: HAD family hydrolase, partial [Proteobacteria bacterium]
FAVSEDVRSARAATISSLAEGGGRTMLLSGDNEQVAEAVGRQLGVDDIVAECTPEQKLTHLKRWQSNGEIVAMVGDGINDAPVLAGADVSISVSGASSIAVSSADIVLLCDDVYAVVNAFDASGKTLRIMKQNLYWAIGYNLMAIPAAAAGLVAPWLAALGMSLSSLIVIGNASRLRGNPKSRPIDDHRNVDGSRCLRGFSEHPTRP